MNMVIGYLMTAFGTAGTFGSIIYIMNDRRYSYTSPFSSHEKTLMAICIISFILLVAGIMTIIFSVIKNKNDGKLNEITGKHNGVKSGNVCTNCGINISANCAKCPRCGCELKDTR
ncbi:MAG: hypothetical protein ACI4RL_07235 [Ruminococcus sp.]